MFKQTNLDNSFQIRNSSEMGYLSHDKYPTQNTEYIGKYICVRHKTQYNQMLNQRFHIPERVYDEYIYPENSGRRRFFQILRWDTEEPFRAILINDSGEVLVAYTTDLEESLYDLVGSKIHISTISRAEKYGYDYLVINETDDPDLFFDKLFYEKTNQFNVQDERYLGIEVWSEYDADLSLKRDVSVLDYKNKYDLSDETMKIMIKRDPILYSMPDEIFKSFPYYYNLREKSYADNARRAINRGYVIRADAHGSVDPEFVVMEVMEDNSVRFVTQHEARFFYNEEVMETRDVYSLVREYINK